MPIRGQNQKAVEARARDQAKKDAEKSRKAKEAEDKLWEDHDKLVDRKLERKEERDKKQQEKNARKQELKKLADEELEAASASVKPASKKGPSNRLTQAQISSAQAKLEAEMAKLNTKKKPNKIVVQEELREIKNVRDPEEESARNIDDAIDILSGGPQSLEKHPEKRVKAAWLEYKEKNMPILKKENPSLKFSQLNNMLFKSFQTAPENPKNQAHAAYNDK